MKKLLALVLIMSFIAPSAAKAENEYTLQKGSQREAVVALQLILSQMDYLDEKYITGLYGSITEDAVKKYQRDSGFSADGIAGDETLSSLLGAGYKDLFDIEAERNEIQAFDYSAVVTQPVSSRRSASSSGSSSPSNSSNSSSNNSNNSNASNSSSAESGQAPQTEPAATVNIPDSGFINAASQAGDSSLQSNEESAFFLGMTSDFVKAIQECLVNLGYLSLSKTTTYFGELTESAVLNFQAAHGLVPNGIVDPGTLSLLVSPYALVAAVPAVGSGSSSASSSTGSNVNVGSSSQYFGSDIASRATNLAMEQAGKPYKYNTRGPDSFDCSGLVYYAFKSFGVTLPTSSSAQSQYDKGMKITSIYDLQVGDVVFFNTGNSQVAINHCGIYIGGGQFVHASSSAKAVIIRPLDSGFYLDAFRWALRVV